MSGLRAILLAALVLGLGLGTQQVLVLRLGYILIGVIVVAAIWSFFAVRGFEITRTTPGGPHNRTQVGQTFVEQLTISRSKGLSGLLPRPWLELHDLSTLPGHPMGQVLGFTGRGSDSWTVETPCVRRGVYRLGPIQLVGADPFGFFRSCRVVGETQEVLVYPETVPLTQFKVPFGNVLGGDVRQTGWHHVTPHASGVREYQPGDSLNRIHWPSSARLQRLMVKEFDLDPSADTWIILDLQASVHVGDAEQPRDSTEEYAVTAAASVAKHFLDRGQSVGVIALGDRQCVLTPERGDRQLIRILEELALVRATGEARLRDVLRFQGVRCQRNNLAIAITPSVDERWPSELRQLSDRGVRTAAVVIEAATFGGPTSSIFLVSALAAANIPTFLVKHGDQLDVALSTQGVRSS